jgi:hypothetical protein
MNAQLLRDTVSLKLIKESIAYIYNLQSDNAEEACRKLDQLYPGHPVVYLLRGMGTYWKYYPLLPSSPTRESYERDMRRCIELSESKHDPADEAEYLLANLSARGMLLLFYSDNDLNMDVFPLATSTYKYIRRSFDYTSAYSDFLFFTGLYNFYREAYPEAYPIYKAFALLFPKGDKAKGVRELQSAAKNSLMFKAEASSFLSGIYMTFENNYRQACNYSAYLHELYPANIQYIAMYIKSLLLIKQYDEAERLIGSSSVKITNSFYQAQLSIFNGILMEKKYHTYNQAEQYYTKGIKDISSFGEYGNEYAAYAYFGLSRISELNGNRHYKKIYRKKALELAEFKKVDFD